MEVVEETNEKFHLASRPTIFSQSAFFGFFAFGFTLSFYSESLFWQLLYILGSFIIASSFLGQWQNLIVDKVSRKLHYEVQNIYQKMFASDRYLVSETLDLEDVRQVKCNFINGTIGFYHNLTTISIYVGNQSKCEAMLAKIKSLMPNPAISRHEGQMVPDVLEDIGKESEEAAATEPMITASVDNNEGEVETGDLPKTLSFDSFKDDDDGLSSDESFVKIDDKEFDECDQGTDVPQLKLEHEDSSPEDALNKAHIEK